MTTPAAAKRVRLVRPEVGPLARHLWAGTTVALIAATTVAGLFSSSIALLAAGAGAGYSLSGSV